MKRNYTFDWSGFLNQQAQYDRFIRSNGMRLIRNAYITTIICSSLAVFSSTWAQDTNIDALLSELSIGDETAVETAEPAVEAASEEIAAETDTLMESGEGLIEEAADVDAVAVDATESAAETEVPAIDDSFFDFGADTEVTGSADAPVVEEAVIEEDVVDDEMTDATEVDVVEDDVVEETVEEVNTVTITEEPDESAKETAKLMAMQEEVRRQEREIKGTKSYNSGKQALMAGNYEEAAKLLEEAKFNTPARPANDAMLEDIRVSLGEAYTEIAKDQLDADINFARKNIDLALQTTPENRKAQSLEKRISAREKKIAEEIARPKSVTKQPKYGEKYKTMDEYLREGRDLFNAREYNDAELAFERVLQLDEYNIEAMRFLRKIDDIRFDIRTTEREATVADMMSMVRDTWNPPIRTDSKLPPGVESGTTIDTISSQQKLQKKMEAIIIPSIEFRQANITDVVNFLVDASVAGDTEGVGVNIILKLSAPGGESAPAAAPAATTGFGDDFGFGSDFGAAPAAPASSGYSSVPAITLNLRRINLLDAIKYITEVADLRYRLEDNVVIITPANIVSGRVVTRMYPVQPSILDVIVEREDSADTSQRTGDFVEMGSTAATIKRSDVKEFFERTGVPFPVGTSITYNQSISQLIVANTAENLETFERILARLNVIPNQVEIEARFVEVNQDNLEELGFQWFLTDDWEIAQRQGSGGPANTESLIGIADPNGLTKGNRFFGKDITTGALAPISTTTKNPNQVGLGGIFSFATVLTNPEVQVVITALSQKGNADLLSAPRITTRSGVNAQIQVVREIIYPTEFEVTEPTISSSTSSINLGTGQSSGGGLVTPPTVTPGSFATREVGVILNVTPTVGPDGYTIDLTLSPEVAELIDWIQYGSTISAGGQTFTYNIPQPVFSSRNVTTSIVVWDGQTVVLGGLIREDLIKFEDKIPFLGDIPILGRFFSTKGEFSQKKNLLIFVTARLVGPDGKPIQRGNAMPTEEAEALPL